MIKLAWVDQIQGRLVVAYGSRFTDQYRGVDPEQVREDWLRGLDGVSAEGIRYALGNLPPHPPNVMQFRELCQRRPEVSATQVAIRDKTGGPGKAERERLRAALARLGGHRDDPLHWARVLKEREAGGELLSRLQRAAWRDALREGKEGSL